MKTLIKKKLPTFHNEILFVLDFFIFELKCFYIYFIYIDFEDILHINLLRLVDRLQIPFWMYIKKKEGSDSLEDQIWPSIENKNCIKWATESNIFISWDTVIRVYEIMTTFNPKCTVFLTFNCSFLEEK